LQRLREAGYQFQTLADFMSSSGSKSVILRHDIDITAVPALRLARLEEQHGISGSYYFRTTRYSFKPQIIKEIASLGHEIGYHYEDLTRNNGNMEAAIRDFAQNLAQFREIYPVRTVCMHGRSGSPYDNRNLWKEINLTDHDLIAEPYLSLDFNKILYLSDTTQKWDGDKIALRDKVQSSIGLSFRTTREILDNIDKLPDQIMITIHPELWTKGISGWLLAKFFVITHGAYKRFYRNKKTQKLQTKIRTDNHE
jgi:hypothetical protein